MNEIFFFFFFFFLLKCLLHVASLGKCSVKLLLIKFLFIFFPRNVGISRPFANVKKGASRIFDQESVQPSAVATMAVANSTTE